MLLELGTRANARQLEQLWRIERAGADDNLLPGPSHVSLLVLIENDALGSLRVRVDDDFCDVGLSENVEVVSMGGRCQEGSSRGPAFAVCGCCLV